MRRAAEAAFNQAIEIDPQYPIAHENLALFYLAQNPPKPWLARWHYEKAIEAGEPRNLHLENWLDQNGAPAGSQTDPGPGK